jgi:DNA-binding transcriptional LysR family regulator
MLVPGRHRMPPLRMIAAFEAVARLGSRAEAAVELNVTPGAVSKQLRALEQWLGVALFNGDLRNGSAMTAEGRRLAMAVTAGMETIQNSVGEIAVMQGPPTELRILVPASLSVNWLLPCLPRLEQEAPALRVRIHATHTGDDWVDLPHDAAIRRDGFVPEGYRREMLFQEWLAAYVGPGLRTSGALEQDIQALPLIESRTRAGDLDRWLAAAGITKVAFPRQRFSHFYTAYEAAVAAQGVIVAPTILASADVARGRLRPFYPKVRIAGAQHALLIPTGSKLPDAVEIFAAFLRRRIAEAETTIDAFSAGAAEA